MAEPERFEPFAPPLEDARRGRRAPESGHAWRGTLSQRARVARRLPQAVLKITSRSHGLPAARARLRYISRGGDLAVELADGTTLDSLEEIDQFAEDWAADFGTRKNSRDVMSLVLSVPKGMDRDKALDAAREFFKETFAENHEYAFAGHDDTKHFHIHLVVKTRGHDGKPMRLKLDDPERWRQVFAEKARARGLALDASPRKARGKGPQRSSAPTPIHQLRRRGIVPKRDQEAVQQAVKRIRSREFTPTEFEQAMRNIHRQERLAFAKQGLEVVQKPAKLEDPAKRLMALEIASDLAFHAECMPRPKSWLENLMEPWMPEEPEPERFQEVRSLTRRVERGLRKQVESFKTPALKRQAIAARARLSDALEDRQPALKQGAKREAEPEIEL